MISHARQRVQDDACKPEHSDRVSSGQTMHCGARMLVFHFLFLDCSSTTNKYFIMETLVLVAILVILATFFLGSTIFAPSRTVEINPASDDVAVEEQEFTPRTLYKYNGFDLEQIYIAVKGNVYDVSKARQFYGPSGPYSNFAGHDASRGLAKNSFDEFRLTFLDLAFMISLDDLTANNLGLINVIAYASYSDQELEEIKESGELAQYAYYNEVPVGLVICKPLQPVSSKSPAGLLIDKLCVLPAYSGKYGLEDSLLEYVENVTRKRHLDKIYVVTEDPSQWHKFGFVYEDASQELYRNLNLVKQGQQLLRKALNN
ncbi:hypothetical protein KL909_001547 [Ogataea angusta]|nr:hypothetical protein KL909_001547 [Ogataea angusta]